MTENDTNKPSEPQDPDTTLKDRRRILEELTPNITAKQLSEQLARMKRAHELDDEQPAKSAVAQDPAPSSATTATPQDSSTSEPKADAPVAEQNHSKPTETKKPDTSQPESGEAEVVLPKATEESAWRIDTAVLLPEEKQAKDETAAPEPEKPEKPEKPEITDKPVQPAEASTSTKTEALPDPQKITEAPALTSEKPAEPAEPAAKVDTAAKAEAPAQPKEADDKDSSSELDHNLGRSPQNKHDTAVLEGKSPFRRALQQKSTGEHQTASLGENREIILVIRGMVERLILQDDKRIILGRTDVKSRFLPDVDLTPYGALDRGVSREHASLHLDGDRLYVTDLGSTNGTFLSGNKLDPNVPSILRKGDELLLGRLPVQVLFR